ncbi:Gfo/Idh/MocA family oxidoreductase [Siminovitchia sp. FSL H7-0308]|uniref:Gfo/Idh/MocA family protein n=1 Tax=unclassified Siminovitchia TaxID=2837530 RepID=UPI00097D5E9A|nr:hypothetical protein BLX87_21910 [Bacillus sp. VT-16-64]
MKTIQVGIIGCGTIAKIRHLPECRDNEHVTIFGVCDVNEERVQKFARTYRTKAFANYEDMLNDPALDAVIISLPHHLHAPAAIYAARAGKHILVEKPIATNLNDACAIVETAKANGVKLMVAHNQRFVPSHKQAKKLIAERAIGRIYSFQATFGHSGPEQWSIDGNDCFYTQPKQEGFGVLGDLAIHKIDLIQFLLQAKIVDVQSMIGSLSRTQTEIEDEAVLAVKMDNGIIGSITASWNYIKPDFSTIIYGENGVIRLEDDPDYPLIIQYRDGTSIKYELPDILEYERKMPGRSQVITSFINSILYDETPPVTGEEALDALSIVVQSIEQQRVVI